MFGNGDGRRGRVMSLRITDEERAEIEAAAKRERDARAGGGSYYMMRSWKEPLGPWIPRGSRSACGRRCGAGTATPLSACFGGRPLAPSPTIGGARSLRVRTSLMRKRPRPPTGRRCAACASAGRSWTSPIPAPCRSDGKGSRAGRNGTPRPARTSLIAAALTENERFPSLDGRRRSGTMGDRRTRNDEHPTQVPAATGRL